MNVLVYSGPEVLQPSLLHTLSTLRTLLLPNYSVQAISQQSLITQPWSSTCALLVFPAFKDVPVISAPFSTTVTTYVEKGGSLLALGAGLELQRAGSLGSLEGTLGNLSIDSSRELKFHDNASDRYIIPKLGVGSEEPQPAVIRLQDGHQVSGVWQHPHLRFSKESQSKNSTILAHYVLQDDIDTPAIIYFPVREGKTVFSNLRLDLPVESASDTSSSAEEQRKALARKTLAILGIEPPAQDLTSPTRPLPQILTSAPSKPSTVAQILAALDIVLSDKPHVLQDIQDKFEFHGSAEGQDLLRNLPSNLPDDPRMWQPKHVIVYTDGALPPRSITPLFDHKAFYDTLSAARVQAGCIQDPDFWGVGEALLYGEAVTSTQTMLDKNPRLLSRLPTPLLSLASFQLAGRGRGSNVWLSPAGCLQFSLLLRVSTADVPAARLVFVQYLFALAVTEACRDDGVLGSRGEQIRLKWPNDIYAVNLGEKKERKKIGGILVHTNFSGKKVEIVIGCGLNVLNAPPIASLSQLVARDEKLINQLSMERTAAIIMAKFERMWSDFVAQKGSFESFMDLYLERWLHSDQLVTLTTVNPPQRVRITGITSDHGLLRTIPQTDGWASAKATGFIDLQPDGNSFDLMEGLIKAKT